MDLIQLIKDWRASSQDKAIINRYFSLEEKMSRLEKKGHVEKFGECGELHIFSKEYTKLWDESQRIYPEVSLAFEREGKRFDLKYKSKYLKAS